MTAKEFKISRATCRVALACLVVPMFASYFFDDMFSSVSHLFNHPENLELGWNAANLGDFIGDYSLLCICGGLIAGGVLLDIFGVRIMGSVFVGMMVGGGALAYYAVSSGLPQETAIALGRIGRMTFGLGSEIAGVAVTRSIAKWFKGGRVSLAMGLHLAVARMGTAVALIAAPLLVGLGNNAPGRFYSIADTARPALVGCCLLLAGAIVWTVFVLLDGRFDRKRGISYRKGEVSEENRFRFKDLLAVMRNPRFLMIGFLCVTFYCCVSSFKKFGTAVVIPRFGIEDGAAGTMVAMIPFFTIVFTPLFGAVIDRLGKATGWMIAGSASVLAGHLLIAFAPSGVAFFGYLGIALLGLGYSLVPSAMWPSVPKIIPDRNLGTAYSLVYWIQNLGLFFVPKIVGRIFSSGDASGSCASGAGQDAATLSGLFCGGLDTVTRVELVFILLAVASIALSLLLRRSSARHPELGLDASAVAD